MTRADKSEKLQRPANGEFRIETSRLLLRPWQIRDREAFAAFAADSGMMRYITDGRPWTEAQIDEFFARQARNLAERGYCMGALALRKSVEVIGVAGIQPQRLAGDDELGWWVALRFQGQGFASEIGSACLRHAFDVLARPRIVAIAHPENAASIRVMRKIGMRYLDTVSAHSLEARYADEPVVRYVQCRDGYPRPRTSHA